jgi:ATP-binding cassette, subfamily B, bacterial CvaB/MchF/RaxB
MRLADALRTGFGRRLPALLQTEAAECGIACLAMIASYHGNAVDVATLRRRFAVSLQGTTLAALCDFAARLGFATRAVRLELDDLCRLALPCVLHWKFTHFVVLRRVGARTITVHDPSRGARTLPLSEAADAFTGVALELWPSPRFERRSAQPRVRLRELVGRIAGLAGSFAQILLVAAALETFVVAHPLFLQWVVDHALVAASAELLALLAIGFGLLVLCEQATAALRSWIVMHFETTLSLQWHANVFAHLLRLPVPYFEKRHLGDVVSRFRSIDAIQRTVTTAAIEAVVDGGMSVVLLIVMFCYSLPLTALCLAAMTLYAAGRWLAHAPLREARHEQIAGAAKQDSHFIETVRGIRAIRLFQRGSERRAAWLTLLVEQVNAGLRAAKLGIALRGANGLLFGLENVLVVYFGASLVLDGQFSTGMLLAFVAYKRQFALRVSALIDKAFEVRLLELHCDRLADIVLTAPAEPADSPGRLVAARAGSVPTVTLRGLRYRYAEHAPFVLDGVDLEIAAGECVAIVGPSGCGKTTLLHVMLGILPASAGDVLIGGVPLSQLQGELRRSIGCVTQNDCLFAGSIADNISFCDASADQARIEECARLTAIHDEIVALPMAYNTLVGFLGSTLSAGQQQRILLARALYARPSVLILDEATSHLDLAHERAVAAALRRLDITRILVAHRPETVVAADRIVRLDAGRVVPVRSAPKVRSRHTARADERQPPPRPAAGMANEAVQDVIANLGC